MTKDVMVLVNPKSPETFASKSSERQVRTPEEEGMWAGSAILPIVNYAKHLQSQNTSEVILLQKEFPTWLAFFDVFTSKFVASVGKNLAISSRLVPTSSLSTPSSQADVVDALLHANIVTSAPGVIILMTTPYTVKDEERKTSVNPKWRESIWHVTNVETWAWNATKEEIRGNYARAKESLAQLRELTRGEDGGAAYVNEADVYEDGWEKSFWGDNYERLLEIKKK